MFFWVYVPSLMVGYIFFLVIYSSCFFHTKYTSVELGTHYVFFITLQIPFGIKRPLAAQPLFIVCCRHLPLLYLAKSGLGVSCEAQPKLG